MGSDLVIGELIEQVTDAAASERNLQRGKTAPQVNICVEEPITSSILFGVDAERYYTDPAYYVEQSLRQKLWRFQNIDDDVPITTDIPASLGLYPEFTFLGMAVRYDAKGIPTIQDDHPLTRSPDLSLLEPVDFRTSGWMPRALRWYDDVSRIVAGRAPVSFITWWRGGLDLAVQLRGYESFVLDTIERPQFLRELMRFLTEQRIAWHEACSAHFGEPMTPASVGDDWINVPFITPAMFTDFVLPGYLELEKRHGGVCYVHSCGNQAPVQHDLLGINSLDVLEVSPWTDLRTSLANVPENKRLYISVHPNEVVVNDAAQVRGKLESIVTACRGRRYALGAGSHPISDERDYLERLRRWITIAREVIAEHAGRGRAAEPVPATERPQHQ